ncbi:peptide/nickel transport system substrate-binding protein [Inhella inkyongensis]|uniref:Peptide/nickel transport system substrate-binding protein n=1 Tax=Inhella inkyongensis TaxID=392593 RepID=A0A840RY71_9BURK|nr:ABC transporter substrate-binding protein [Inhella inkyongensis]MBB5203657.1 peptide/nickel transport system substrate-binding protein [Inhella inkyongensis]
MKNLLLAAALAAALHSGAPAQTLRWASQGDLQTADPHSQNESMTNMVNGQVYEKLVTRGKDMSIVPALATEWSNPDPLTWRFKLRQGVKFHDGAPFTADDVVFSMARSRETTSQLLQYGNAVGIPKKIDAHTVEFKLEKPNPVFLQHLDLLWIMNKAWAEKHRVTRPQDFKNKEESHTSINANGTGPYMLVSRQPGQKNVFKRNPNWWGKFEGNVEEIVFTPIGNDATRLAALISGELDLVLDPAPRDVQRLRSQRGLQIIDGPENRIVFIGMDQARDSLLYGKSPDGKNPFKDLRVRQALYQAIDIEGMRTKLMQGLAQPTGGLTPSPKASFDDPTLQTRLPYDLAAAKKLMADAGYAEGFEVTLDCPNNRYINDEEICLTLASMWAQLKVKVKVNAMPRVLFFPKLEKVDTSLYLYGWGGAITDAESIFAPVYRNRGEKGIGSYNYGGWKNDKFDQLAAQSSSEVDPKKREALIRAALTEFRSQIHTIPLHRQVIPWAARAGVKAVHRPDNWLEVAWVTVPGK